MFKKPIFPILFSIYPAIFLFSTNIYLTNLFAFWNPFWISVAIGVGLFFLINFIFKNIYKSAFISFFISFFFFSFGHFQLLIHTEILKAGFYKKYPDFDFELGINYALSFLYFLLFSGLFIKIKKASTESLQKLTPIFNTVTLVLLVSPSVKILNFIIKKENQSSTSIEFKIKDAPKIIQKLGYKPDIYNIILDGHAREDVFKNFYHEDNSFFFQGLRDRGFEVPKYSQSNYYWTFLSLASSLSMMHVNFFENEKLSKKGRVKKAHRMTQNSHVSQFLRKHGYQTIHFGSTSAATAKNQFAEKFISCNTSFLTQEFTRVFLETTWLKVYRAQVTSDLAECHLSILEKLKTIAHESSPKFVFAHFVPPHHPYLFDREGKIIKNATVSNQFNFQQGLWYRYSKYVDQAVFMEKSILKVIDEILKNSKNPPIILLQSDHGSHVKGFPLEKIRHIRFANFAALYHPEKTKIFSDQITAVNYFRSIFNYYFDAEFPLQEDKTYYSAHHKSFKFHEIPFLKGDLFPIQNSSKKE